MTYGKTLKALLQNIADMALRLAIVGLPGAGKGTQAKKIAATYDIPHISMGDLFRNNKDYAVDAEQTVGDIIDRGDPIPTEVTAQLLGQRLEKPDCADGFVVDGFPRWGKQAEAVADITELDALLIINVTEEEIYERLTNRRICPDCGDQYHLLFDPPAEDERCDNCGTDLVQREDDTRERIAERIEWQRNGLKELRDFYDGTDMIEEVNGEGTIKKVWEDVQEVIAQYAD